MDVGYHHHINQDCEEKREGESESLERSEREEEEWMNVIILLSDIRLGRQRTKSKAILPTVKLCPQVRPRIFLINVTPLKDQREGKGPSLPVEEGKV